MFLVSARPPHLQKLKKKDGVDFEERMAEIHKELLSLQAESNDLMDTISQNMKEMGL